MADVDKSVKLEMERKGESGPDGESDGDHLDRSL